MNKLSLISQIIDHAVNHEEYVGIKQGEVIWKRTDKIIRSMQERSIYNSFKNMGEEVTRTTTGEYTINTLSDLFIFKNYKSLKSIKISEDQIKLEGKVYKISDEKEAPTDQLDRKAIQTIKRIKSLIKKTALSEFLEILNSNQSFVADKIKPFSKELLNDREFILRVCSKQPSALQFAHEDLKKDREIVLAAVKSYGTALEFAHNDLKKDREIVLAAVKSWGKVLEFAHDDLKNDKEIVLAAVKGYGYALRYASNSLKKDKEVVLAAVMQNGNAFDCAHIDLQKDKEVILAAINERGWVFEDIHNDLKKDKEIALAAVKKDGDMLKHAHDDLKKDKEVVLAAVKRSGSALYFAHDDLKKDREVALAAVMQSGYVLQYVHIDLRKDKEIVIAALREAEIAFDYARDDLKKDKEVVLALVTKNGLSLRFICADLIKDKEVVLAAVNQNGYALKFVPDDLKNDKEIVLQAVKQKGQALEYASNSLKKDPEVVLAAVHQDIESFNYTPPSLKNNKEFALDAVKQNGLSLRYIDDDLKNDKDVVLAAVRQKSDALQYAHEILKKDAEVVLTAMNQNGEAYKYAHDDLKNDLEFMYKAAKVISLNTWERKKHESQSNFLLQACEKIDNIDHLNLAMQKDREAAVKRKLQLYDWYINMTNSCQSSPINPNEIPLETWHCIIDLPDPTMRKKLSTLIASMNKNDLDNYKRILPKQAKEQSYLAALFLSRIFSNPEDCKKLWEKINSRTFKDGQMQIPLFQALDSLYKAGFDSKELLLILNKAIFEPKDKDIIKRQLQSLPAIIALGGTEQLKNDTHDNLLDISRLLKESFKSQVPLSEKQLGKIDFNIAMSETFLSKRSSDLLYVYAGSLKKHSEKKRALTTLALFISLVLKKEFKAERYEKSDHLKKIFDQNSGLKDKWMKGAEETFTIGNKEEKSEKSIDFLEFFRFRIQHKHLDLTKYPYIDGFINKNEKAKLDLAKTLNEKISLSKEVENSELSRLQFELNIINLIRGVERVKQEKLIKESLDLLSKLDEVAELNNDLRGLLPSFKPQEKQSIYTLKDSDDYWEIFLSGQVQGSCQRADGNPKLNCGLLGYLLDGKNRLLEIIDGDNKIVGRRLFRLVLRSDGKPVLMMEKIYPDTLSNELEKALNNFAQKRAKDLGLDLYEDSKEGDTELQSISGKSPWEYVDSAGGIQKDGKFKIPKAKRVY